MFPPASQRSTCLGLSLPGLHAADSFRELSWPTYVLGQLFRISHPFSLCSRGPPFSKRMKTSVLGARPIPRHVVCAQDNAGQRCPSSPDPVRSHALPFVRRGHRHCPGGSVVFLSVGLMTAEQAMTSERRRAPQHSSVAGRPELPLFRHQT